MENDAKKNYGPGDLNFQDNPQTSDSKELKLNYPIQDLYIDNEGFPTYETTDDSDSDNSLSHYDDDKKNSEMEEGLENRTDFEEEDIQDDPDPDETDLDDDEDEDEDDTALEEESELEEDINSDDANPDDEINPEDPNDFYLKENRRNYYSVFDI